MIKRFTSEVTDTGQYYYDNGERIFPENFWDIILELNNQLERMTILKEAKETHCLLMIDLFNQELYNATDPKVKEVLQKLSNTPLDSNDYIKKRKLLEYFDFKSKEYIECPPEDTKKYSAKLDLLQELVADIKSDNYKNPGCDLCDILK